MPGTILSGENLFRKQDLQGHCPPPNYILVDDLDKEN